MLCAIAAIWLFSNAIYDGHVPFFLAPLQPDGITKEIIIHDSIPVPYPVYYPLVKTETATVVRKETETSTATATVTARGNGSERKIGRYEGKTHDRLPVEPSWDWRSLLGRFSEGFIVIVLLWLFAWFLRWLGVPIPFLKFPGDPGILVRRGNGGGGGDGGGGGGGPSAGGGPGSGGPSSGNGSGSASAQGNDSGSGSTSDPGGAPGDASESGTASGPGNSPGGRDDPDSGTSSTTDSNSDEGKADRQAVYDLIDQLNQRSSNTEEGNASLNQQLLNQVKAIAKLEGQIKGLQNGTGTAGHLAAHTGPVDASGELVTQEFYGGIQRIISNLQAQFAALQNSTGDGVASGAQTGPVDADGEIVTQKSYDELQRNHHDVQNERTALQGEVQQLRNQQGQESHQQDSTTESDQSKRFIKKLRDENKRLKEVNEEVSRKLRQCEEPKAASRELEAQALELDGKHKELKKGYKKLQDEIEELKKQKEDAKREFNEIAGQLKEREESKMKPSKSEGEDDDEDVKYAKLKRENKILESDKKAVQDELAETVRRLKHCAQFYDRIVLADSPDEKETLRRKAVDAQIEALEDIIRRRTIENHKLVLELKRQKEKFAEHRGWRKPSWRKCRRCEELLPKDCERCVALDQGRAPDDTVPGLLFRESHDKAERLQEENSDLRKQRDDYQNQLEEMLQEDTDGNMTVSARLHNRLLRDQQMLMEEKTLSDATAESLRSHISTLESETAPLKAGREASEAEVQKLRKRIKELRNQEIPLKVDDRDDNDSTLREHGEQRSSRTLNPADNDSAAKVEYNRVKQLLDESLHREDMLTKEKYAYKKRAEDCEDADGQWAKRLLNETGPPPKGTAAYAVFRQARLAVIDAAKKLKASEEELQSLKNEFNVQKKRLEDCERHRKQNQEAPIQTDAARGVDKATGTSPVSGLNPGTDPSTGSQPHDDTPDPLPPSSSTNAGRSRRPHTSSGTPSQNADPAESQRKSAPGIGAPKSGPESREPFLCDSQRKTALGKDVAQRTFQTQVSQQPQLSVPGLPGVPAVSGTAPTSTQQSASSAADGDSLENGITSQSTSQTGGQASATDSAAIPASSTEDSASQTVDTRAASKAQGVAGSSSQPDEPTSSSKSAQSTSQSSDQPAASDPATTTASSTEEIASHGVDTISASDTQGPTEAPSQTTKPASSGNEQSSSSTVDNAAAPNTPGDAEVTGQSTKPASSEIQSSTLSTLPSRSLTTDPGPVPKGVDEQLLNDVRAELADILNRHAQRIDGGIYFDLLCRLLYDIRPQQGLKGFQARLNPGDDLDTEVLLGRDDPTVTSEDRLRLVLEWMSSNGKLLMFPYHDPEKPDFVGRRPAGGGTNEDSSSTSQDPGSRGKGGCSDSKPPGQESKSNKPGEKDGDDSIPDNKSGGASHQGAGLVDGVSTTPSASTSGTSREKKAPQPALQPNIQGSAVNATLGVKSSTEEEAATANANAGTEPQASKGDKTPTPKVPVRTFSTAFVDEMRTVLPQYLKREAFKDQFLVETLWRSMRDNIGGSDGRFYEQRFMAMGLSLSDLLKLFSTNGELVVFPTETTHLVRVRRVAAVRDDEPPAEKQKDSSGGDGDSGAKRGDRKPDGEKPTKDNDGGDDSQPDRKPSSGAASSQGTDHVDGVSRAIKNGDEAPTGSTAVDESIQTQDHQQSAKGYQGKESEPTASTQETTTSSPTTTESQTASGLDDAPLLFDLLRAELPAVLQAPLFRDRIFGMSDLVTAIRIRFELLQRSLPRFTASQLYRELLILAENDLFAAIALANPLDHATASDGFDDNGVTRSMEMGRFSPGMQLPDPPAESPAVALIYRVAEEGRLYIQSRDTWRKGQRGTDQGLFTSSFNDIANLVNERARALYLARNPESKKSSPLILFEHHDLAATIDYLLMIDPSWWQDRVAEDAADVLREWMQAAERVAARDNARQPSPSIASESGKQTAPQTPVNQTSPTRQSDGNQSVPGSAASASSASTILIASAKSTPQTQRQTWQTYHARTDQKEVKPKFPSFRRWDPFTGRMYFVELSGKRLWHEPDESELHREGGDDHNDDDPGRRLEDPPRVRRWFYFPNGKVGSGKMKSLPVKFSYHETTGHTQWDRPADFHADHWGRLDEFARQLNRHEKQCIANETWRSQNPGHSWDPTLSEDRWINGTIPAQAAAKFCPKCGNRLSKKHNATECQALNREAFSAPEQELMELYAEIQRSVGENFYLASDVGPSADMTPNYFPYPDLNNEDARSDAQGRLVISRLDRGNPQRALDDMLGDQGQRRPTIPSLTQVHEVYNRSFP